MWAVDGALNITDTVLHTNKIDLFLFATLKSYLYFFFFILVREKPYRAIFKANLVIVWHERSDFILACVNHKQHFIHFRALL